jgi:hypothetical protein
LARLSPRAKRAQSDWRATNHWVSKMIKQVPNLQYDPMSCFFVVIIYKIGLAVFSGASTVHIVPVFFMITWRENVFLGKFVFPKVSK